MKNQYQYAKVAPKEARTGSDGFVYDSKTEMQRGEQLRLLEKAGIISSLKRQVHHKLILPNGKHVLTKTGKTATYTSDFEYFDNEKNEYIIEDCKGYQDNISSLRISVFEAITDRKVRIVDKNGNLKN